MKLSRGVLFLALFGNAAAATAAGGVTNTVEEVEHATANEHRRMPKHEEYYHPVPMPTYHYIQAAYPKTPYPTHRPPTPYPTGRAPTPKPTPYPTPYPTPHPVQPYRPPPKAYPEPNYDPYYPPPTPVPTRQPTLNPTVHPTPDPTSRPTPAPTRPPTRPPTLAPTAAPTARPTTVAPTTRRPTVAPTPIPTHRPTPIPTTKPTFVPTKRPSAAPSISDTPTTTHPSHTPSENPTNSEEPSDNPTQSEEPSDFPTQSEEPSDVPTQSEEPSEFPTQSEEPSEFPTQSEEPSEFPTFFFIRFDDDDDAFRTNFPRPIPQPIVQRVTLLQIICAPANAGVLGEFCRAIRFVGLADVLNNGAILGNANGLIAGQIQNNVNLVVDNALLNANVRPGGGFREGGFQVVDFGGKRKLVAKESVELEEEQSRTDKDDGRDLQVPPQGYNYDYTMPLAQVGGIVVSNNNVANGIGINNQLPLPLDQYTVFGPTNAAFEYLGRETLDYLYSDAGKDMFRNIINYHIINRRLSFNELNCDTDHVMRNGVTTRTKCRIGGEKFQVGQGNTQRRDEPKIVFNDTFAVNGVLHIVDHVILPNIREPTRPPTFSPTPATCICDNATCLGGVRMTYNRQRCAATTQFTNPSRLNYCNDNLGGGLLPSGVDPSERIGYALFSCDNVGNPELGSGVVLNGESTDFNIRDTVGGECLPQCLQVRIFSLIGDTGVPDNLLQTFNVDTSCAGNTLVGNTNYGAFYYPGENFNVMCPVGKK